MPLKLLGSAAAIPSTALADLEAQVQVVRAATQAAHDLAEKAEGTGQDARQMARNRDAPIAAAAAQALAAEQQATMLAGQVTTLAALAANVTSLSDASTADRKQLNTRTAALEAVIALLQAKAIEKREKRVATTQILALGASVDLTVTWDQPFTDAAYLAIPLLDASTGVANVNPPAIKSQTKTGCVVTVRANVAVAAGLAVNVVGLRFG